MLTKEDLSAIEKIVVRIVEKVLDEKLKIELDPIRTDIIMIKSDIKKIKVDMKKMERRLENKIIKNGNMIISYFEKRRGEQDKRLYRIENHLHLPPMVFDRSR